MQEAILSAKELCKNYTSHRKEHVVLDHINLDIFKGDFTIIMGPSGAGKSTLLYALSGMDTISGGSVNLFKKQEELHKKSEKEMAALRSEKFGFIFQQTHLVSNLTVEDNVLVAGYNGKKKTYSDVKARTDQLLTQLHIEKISSQLPGQTSGGEAQRAAIARALINEPEIIFADEPTGALNRTNTINILDILTALNHDGQSILMVTHDVKAAIRGTRILYLLDGKIAGELKFPPYLDEDAMSRNEQITQWLKRMEW